MKPHSIFLRSSVARQSGFSLFEVLLAMFIAAVAVAGVMTLHARSLKQVNDNANLMRAQRVLNNAAARINVDASLNDSMQSEAENQGMKNVAIDNVSSAKNGQTGRLLSIRWGVHDAKAAVWKCEATAVPETSCLELWVLP